MPITSPGTGFAALGQSIQAQIALEQSAKQAEQELNARVFMPIMADIMKSREHNATLLAAERERTRREDAARAQTFTLETAKLAEERRKNNLAAGKSGNLETTKVEYFNPLTGKNEVTFLPEEQTRGMTWLAPIPEKTGAEEFEPPDEEFLKTNANQIAQVARGDKAITGWLMRDPYWKKIYWAAVEANPQLSEATFPQIKAARVSATSGGSSKMLDAYNQGSVHAARLYNAIEELDNTEVGGANWLANKAAGNMTAFNKKRAEAIGHFNESKEGLKNEFAKIVSGKGGTIPELENIDKTITLNSPKSIQLSSLKTIWGMMLDRVGVERDKYIAGVGMPPEFQFLRGEARTLSRQFEGFHGKKINEIDPPVKSLSDMLGE